MSDFFLGLFLVIVGLIFTIILLRYAFSNQAKSKETFIAVDGSKFNEKKLCEEYDYIYKRLEILYQEEALANARNKKKVIGLNITFVNQIKNNGFSDLKTLISFKEDFKKLAELLDTQDIYEKNMDN